MTTRLVLGAISAEAHRLATNLLHHLLRDAPLPPAPADSWTGCVPSGDVHAPKAPLLGFTRMLSDAAEHSGRRQLGLDMAGAAPERANSIFGDLFTYAPTVGDALESLCRYFPVGQTGTTVALTQASGTACLRYEILDPSVDDRLQDAAYTLGKIYRSLRRTAGDGWALEHVTLAVPTPRVQEPYVRFFRAPVTFDAQATMLCFSSRVLDQAIASADAQRYARFCEHLERRLPERHEPDVLEAALRVWMGHAVPSGRATLEHAAADFGVTPRTMQRRLKAQGISFQPLLVQVRMENARRMLIESRMPVTRIAEQLGFSETSAFTRAFRSHAQQSPRAFRQAGLAGAPVLATV